MNPDELAPLNAAIIRQFPELAGAKFHALTESWDCVAIDADDRMIFKFPRNARAAKDLGMECAILPVVRSRVSLAVPDIRLFAGPPPFSAHPKLQGAQLTTDTYALLPEAVRAQLGADLGLFYAQLHRIGVTAAVAVGVKPLVPWLSAAEIETRAMPLLATDQRLTAARILTDYAALGPDPYPPVYGFYDGHGWNMAFDHTAGRLNGLYDFADSGIGPLHQEFIYSNFISPDLTARIVAAYERETGLLLDRQRIETLTGAHRLWELAELSDDPQAGHEMAANFALWCGMLAES